METLKSAVLLDIENLFIAVKDDLKVRRVRASAKDIAELLYELIMTVASGETRVKYLFGAVSLPLLGLKLGGDESGIYKARKEMLAVEQVFVDSGFEVTKLSSSKNASDNVLKRLAREVKEDPEVGEVFLCSGDGREPFPQLVDSLKESGKRVSVVVYDKIPLDMKGADDFIILNQHVHLRLDNDAESGSLVLYKQDIPEKKVVDSDKKETPDHIYRNVIRDIQEGQESRHQVYYERLKQVVSVLDRYFCRSPGSYAESVFRIISILERNFPEFEKGEHRILFFALLDCTDFFFSSHHYGIESESKFRVKLQLIK